MPGQYLAASPRTKTSGWPTMRHASSLQAVTRIGLPFIVAPPWRPSGEEFVEDRIVDDACDRLAVVETGDGDAEAWFALYEVLGAVDGVDHPDPRLCAVGRIVPGLFRQPAITGARTAQALRDQVVQRDVGLGDDVARRLVPGLRAFLQPVERKLACLARDFGHEGKVCVQLGVSVRQERARRSGGWGNWSRCGFRGPSRGWRRRNIEGRSPATVTSETG